MKCWFPTWLLSTSGMASDPLPGDVWGCGHSVATFTHGISLQSPDIKFYFSLTVGAAQQSGPPPHQAQLPRPNSGRVMTRGPRGCRTEKRHSILAGHAGSRDPAWERLSWWGWRKTCQATPAVDGGPRRLLGSIRGPAARKEPSSQKCDARLIYNKTRTLKTLPDLVF